MRTFISGLLSLCGVGLLLVPACGGGGVQLADIPGVDGGEGGANGPRGVGERCDDGGVCRPGLACTGGVCQPGRSLEEGAACVISAECKDGLYCGPERTCAPAGTGEAGTSCSSDADCKSGLRCNLVGFGTACQPEGTTDLGGACATSADCFGGLFCAENVCVAPPPGGPLPIGIPKFKGVECEDEAASPVTAHFRVPRGSGDGDFFRLPFPNDIRRKDGKLDLTGFPTPGADLLGFDLVDRWARYLERTATGFSVYPTVTFRFSGEIDFESLKVEGATRFIDVSPNEGNDLGHQWVGTTGRSNYVCFNSLSFRPPAGAPLQHGHTYAVLVTNASKAKDGSAIVRSPDLDAVLGPNDPGGVLEAAWKAYEPLRAWAASKAFDLSTVVNAAVFTVGDHDAIARAIPAAVNAAPAPTVSHWVKCGSGQPSPCPQAEGDRACPTTPAAEFDEYHALVTLPQFQQGTPPFTDPTDGGDFVLDSEGKPAVQGTTEVCMSVTVPKGTAPAGKWPIVVYAHGTGGSFRSHVTEGVAARLAGLNVAVLGIDQVGHGPRRGASTAAPETVFFNFTNPAAARGNVLQGAADQVSLVRVAKDLTIPPGVSGNGNVQFGKIAFWGHSQGATEGSIVMPYVPAADVAGVVYSGVGGSLIDALLSKRNPVHLAALAPIVLSELPVNVTAMHPALALFQNAIDPADPIDHAAAAIGTGTLAKHVFVPYGQGDTYSPPATQLAYVVAARLGVAQAPAGVTPDDLGRTPLPLPVQGNAAGVTAVVRQYAPDGYDGHFVVFRNAEAKTNTDRFLADVLGSAGAPAFGR